MTMEIKLSRGKVALVDDADYEWLNQWKWLAYKNRNSWYACRSDGTPMHRLITNAPNGMIPDHINGDGLDNRRKNLRVCTKAENQRNRKLNKNSTTGYKGVNWRNDNKNYIARIAVGLRRITIGVFDDPIEAARAYDVAAKKYHGEFARLNFPNE